MLHFRKQNHLFMKKFLLASLCLSICFLSNAQISKGSVLLGGGISASTGKGESNTSSSKSNGFTLKPSFGFAAKDNQVFGVTVGYGRGKTKSDNSTSESNNHNAGVFYRRYLPLGKAFYLFGEAGFGYHSGKTENKTPATSSENLQQQTNIGLSLFPGVTYAVSKKFHLEASINNLFSLYYHKSKNEQTTFGDTNKNENSGVSLDANMSASTPLTLGFRFVLGK